MNLKCTDERFINVMQGRVSLCEQRQFESLSEHFVKEKSAW